MATRLPTLPATRAAWVEGTLSAGQVKAIAANLSQATVELFAEHEADLVAVLAPLGAGDVVMAMRQWRALAGRASSVTRDGRGGAPGATTTRPPSSSP